MAGAEEVVTALQDIETLEWAALVLNERGLERARAASGST